MSHISKIAVIHPTFNYSGGAENLILWTLEEFKKIGISSTVFTRTLRNNISPYIKQEYINISINPFIFKKEASKLLEKIVNFDAVIIHNFPATILWGYVYKEAINKNIQLPKSFWYCHEPSVRLYGHDELTYKKAIKTLDTVAKYTIALDKFGVSKIDKIFANSKRTASHIKTVYSREALVIYPAIEKTDIKINSSKKSTHFMYVGRIEKPKNIDSAIKAFKLFLESTKDYSVKFLIAGKGSDKKRLVNIVKCLKLENNVEFLGYITDKEKINLLQKSYAMVLPAIYEPFGLSVIEAFICNTTAILSKDTGVSELVDGACILTDVKDINKLSESMVEIYSKREYSELLLKKSSDLLKSGVFFIDYYAQKMLDEIEHSF